MSESSSTTTRTNPRRPLFLNEKWRDPEGSLHFSQLLTTSDLLLFPLDQAGGFAPAEMAVSAAWIVVAASASGPPNGRIVSTVTPWYGTNGSSGLKIGSTPEGLPAALKNAVAYCPSEVGLSVAMIGKKFCPVTTLEDIASAVSSPRTSATVSAQSNGGETPASGSGS